MRKNVKTLNSIYTLQGMLTPKLLGEDLRTLCKLIDDPTI